MQFTSARIYIFLSWVLLVEQSSCEIELMGQATLKMQQSIAQCVVNVAKSAFDKGSIIGTAKAGLKIPTNSRLPVNTKNIVLELLMKDLNWTLIQFEAKSFWPQKRKVNFAEINRIDNYILFIKSERECDEMISMLLNSTSWNPHANFQIFVDYLERDWRTFVTYLLSAFWKHFVINVVVNIPVTETLSHSKASRMS